MTGRGRAAYVEAAQAILAADGPDGLTIAALCDRMHVTTGAFYYHFPSMGEFVTAYAADREAFFTDMFDTTGREPDPLRRLEMLAEAAFAMSHRAEAAFRAWGNSNPTVKTSLARMDAHAEVLYYDTLAEVLGDRERAVMLGNMGLSIVIGLLHRERAEDVALFAAIALEFYTANLGLDAEVVDVDGLPALRLHRRTGI